MLQALQYTTLYFPAWEQVLFIVFFMSTRGSCQLGPCGCCSCLFRYPDNIQQALTARLAAMQELVARSVQRAYIIFTVRVWGWLKCTWSSILSFESCIDWFDTTRPQEGWTETEERYKNRLKESLTVSVLRVCQFTSLVVFLWRLLISAECRLQFYCQRWWKEERERERGGKLYSCQQRGICDRSRVVPNAGAKHGDSLSSCLLTHVFAAGPLAAESHSWEVDAVRNCSV